MEIKDKNILHMVRNILKTNKNLNDTIPQVAWNGIKPSATYVNIFESIGYVYIDDRIRTKLDEKEQNDDLCGGMDVRLYSYTTLTKERWWLIWMSSLIKKEDEI